MSSVVQVDWRKVLVEPLLVDEYREDLRKAPFEEVAWLIYADSLEESGNDNKAQGVRRWIAGRVFPIHSFPSTAIKKANPGTKYTWDLRYIHCRSEQSMTEEEFGQLRGFRSREFKDLVEYHDPWEALQDLFRVLGERP